jgi:hypothetical protein
MRPEDLIHSGAILRPVARASATAPEARTLHLTAPGWTIPIRVESETCRME